MVHAAALVGNIQDVNAEQDWKVLLNVLTFIFDGKTILFNWKQLLNV